MHDKIANTITSHQMRINELEEIKRNVKNSLNDPKFIIEINAYIGFLEAPMIKRKNVIETSSDTMALILNELIQKEKERIDKLIDMEIEKRIRGRIDG